MKMAKRFLLTDDDIDDREIFAEALAAIDPTIVCHHAQDGQEALQFLLNREAGTPDMIFLDINMPVMDGWQLLSALKSHSNFQDIPVIMYSTSSESKDRYAAMNLGALCFVTKPHNYVIVKNMLEIVVNYLKQNELTTVCMAIQDYLKNAQKSR